MTSLQSESVPLVDPESNKRSENHKGSGSRNGHIWLLTLAFVAYILFNEFRMVSLKKDINTHYKLISELSVSTTETAASHKQGAQQAREDLQSSLATHNQTLEFILEKIIQVENKEIDDFQNISSNLQNQKILNKKELNHNQAQDIKIANIVVSLNNTIEQLLHNYDDDMYRYGQLIKNDTTQQNEIQEVEDLIHKNNNSINSLNSSLIKDEAELKKIGLDADKNGDEVLNLEDRTARIELKNSQQSKDIRSNTKQIENDSKSNSAQQVLIDQIKKIDEAQEKSITQNSEDIKTQGASIASITDKNNANSELIKKNVDLIKANQEVLKTDFQSNKSAIEKNQDDTNTLSDSFNSIKSQIKTNKEDIEVHTTKISNNEMKIASAEKEIKTINASIAAK